MFGKTCRPSGQCASPSERMVRAEARVMSCPSNTIIPAVGCNKPEIAFKVVVLPAPFAPMSATSSPLPTVSDTPLSAGTWP